jgi:salicylate hydroxylase
LFVRRRAGIDINKLENSMRLIVVGAGIAGLAAAVGLRRAGHKVTVVERAPVLGEVGAGVVLGPHAMRCLDRLGAAGHIRALNERPDGMNMYDIQSGERRLNYELGAVGAELYGADLYTTHRRDLIDALAGQLGDVELLLGRTVTTITEHNRSVTVTLSDGAVLEAEGLVGADGLNSTVRGSLFGQVDTTFTGFLAWRSVLPTAKLPRPLPNSISLGMGPRRHAVWYPIRKGRQFYAAFYVPAAEIHREDWSASGDVRELKASFSDASKQIQELVEVVDEAFITGIFYREPLSKWHSRRVVLVGDAAHSVLPTSGSGAGVALEDAIALAACIDRHDDALADAFSEFQARRKPRTSRLLISSKADLVAYQEADPAKRAARAAMARGISQLDPTGHARQEWLYGYDEGAECLQPLEQFLRGKVRAPKRAGAQRAFAAWQGAVRLEDTIDGWVSEREAYDAFLHALLPWPEGVEVTRVEAAPARGYRVTPQGCGDGPGLLHIHGGCFVYGDAAGAVALAARIAQALGGWAFVPDYRLAPESESVAMAEDLDRAYDWVQSLAAETFVSAEDAGACLALGLAQRAHRQRQAQPLALYLISPLVDLSLGGKSLDANTPSDPWISRHRLVNAVGAFIQGCAPTDPEIAPMMGDLSQLPPVRIFAAEDEALIDDARELARCAGERGVDVLLRTVPDSVHRYPLFEFLPESEAFVAEVARDGKALRDAVRDRHPRPADSKP